MVVASFEVLALIRFAASAIVFKGCDWEPVFLSLPFLAFIYNSSDEAMREGIVVINNKNNCLTIIDFVEILLEQIFHEFANNVFMFKAQRRLKNLCGIFNFSRRRRLFSQWRFPFSQRNSEKIKSE